MQPARGDVAGTLDFLASLVDPATLVTSSDDDDYAPGDDSFAAEDCSVALTAGAAQELPQLPGHGRQLGRRLTTFGDVLRTCGAVAHERCPSGS